MSQLNFPLLALYFTLYSAMGWVCETVWCSVANRKLVSRGFLGGPWCPIYGLGALLILGSTSALPQNPLLIFIVSMTLASVLEYATGWLLEALFQARWWDYSQRRFHLKGRVCLRNSLLFGMMGLVLTLFIHPPVKRLISLIASDTQRILSSFIIALLVLDLAHTLYAITGLKERLRSLKSLLQELEKHQHTYSWYNKADPAASIATLRALCEAGNVSEASVEMLRQIETLEKHKGGLRILHAFPSLGFQNLNSETQTLRKEWYAKRSARRRKTRSNRVAALKEMYSGVTFTRMVWVFLIGSVIGYIVETLFCLAKLGFIESRQGMLYGPFSQIYGFGAVMMVLLLTPFMKRGDKWLFFGGAVVGGVFEAVCSVIQELMFGTVSWEYSAHAFSLLGGRTNLIYMLFWGILAFVYLKLIYPRMIQFIDNLATRPKRFFTYVIVIFLCANMLLSSIAVARWSNRVANIPAKNSVEVWLDERYPNEMLQEIYPNMQFVSQRKGRS